MDTSETVAGLYLCLPVISMCKLTVGCRDSVEGCRLLCVRVAQVTVTTRFFVVARTPTEHDRDLSHPPSQHSHSVIAQFLAIVSTVVLVWPWVSLLSPLDRNRTYHMYEMLHLGLPMIRPQ